MNIYEDPDYKFSASDCESVLKMSFATAIFFKNFMSKYGVRPVPVSALINNLIRLCPQDMNITFLSLVRYLLGLGICKDKQTNIYWFVIPTSGYTEFECINKLVNKCARILQLTDFGNLGDADKWLRNLVDEF